MCTAVLVFKNLPFSHSGIIQHIRNYIGTKKSVGNFIKGLPTRIEDFKFFISTQFPESKCTKLTSMCELRLIENHGGFIQFIDIFIS